MSTRKKRQHFVPQGYLERFQNENSTLKVSKIWVVDRSKEEAFDVPIRTVASRHAFYDSEFDKNIEEFEKNGIENLLEIEERKFYHSLKILDEAIEDKQDIPDSIKASIAWYLYLQLIRTSKFRNDIDIPKGTSNPEYQKLAQIYGFAYQKMSRKFIEMCLTCVWVVYEMKGNLIIFTSDNPVCITFDGDEEVVSAAMRNEDLTFTSNKGMRIMFPIDSKHVLFLYDRSVRSDTLINENKVVDFDSNEALSLWSSLCSNCERQIYISTNDTFVEVIKSLMSLGESISPVLDLLTRTVDHIKAANKTISGTRINSYAGYIATAKAKPIFIAIKNIFETS